jgi:drug/metabolite transporter (DMT)-like permease
MSSAASDSVQSASLKGMGLGILAHSLFSLHDAMIKGVVADLPAPQILFVRSIVILLICFAVGRRNLLVDLMHSPNRMLIFGRGLLTLAAWIMYYSAGRELQLAEMTTLYYFAPVLTTMMAVIFLKEQLTLARIGAASIGFFGVIVAANPAGFSLSLPVMMVLAAALSWAIAMILMRTISRSDSTLVQVFAQNLLHALVMGLIALPLWQGMEGWEIALCIGAGLVGGCGQFTLVEAARVVPASVLGTVEYGALIWSFIFGYMFWGEMPATTVYVGAFLVVAAGLTLALSERRNRREMTQVP